MSPAIAPSKLCFGSFALLLCAEHKIKADIYSKHCSHVIAFQAAKAAPRVSFNIVRGEVLSDRLRKHDGR